VKSTGGVDPERHVITLYRRQGRKRVISDGQRRYTCIRGPSSRINGLTKVGRGSSRDYGSDINIPNIHPRVGIESPSA
jgi:hypothetical protein